MLLIFSPPVFAAQVVDIAGLFTYRPDAALLAYGVAVPTDVALFRVAFNGQKAELVAMAAGPQQSSLMRLAALSGSQIAVLYPDIGEPYRSVFTKIIEGIEDKARVRVASYAVGNKLNTQELAGELKRQNVRAVIALGRNGLRAANALEGSNLSIVAGGVLAVPESEARGVAVHSLAPDPDLMFARLKLLVPQARRVYVVCDPRQNAWLMQLARTAAKAQGLELQVREATDLKTAMQHYQSIFSSSDARHDTVWLPQDSTTVEESAVLPLVLQEAWNRNIAVFSSSLSHVKRGVLFSLYPDNMGLGRNLAQVALANADGASGLVPLKDVLVAVNLRTASHLGLNLGNKPQQNFDLVFPEP